jgi:hypothetical protein
MELVRNLSNVMAAYNPSLSATVDVIARVDDRPKVVVRLP